MTQDMTHMMNMTYRSKKQVTRELEGSTHTLPILFEYAWSMLRVCLEYAYSMPRVCLAYAYTHLIWEPAISVRARRTASPLLTDRESAPYGLFRTLLLLVVMLVMGVGEMSSADYKYIIINNKGNEAFNYIISTETNYNSIDKTKFCVHLKARSVLATNFRFYTTKTDAQADANGTIGSHYSEGNAIPDPTNENKTFYVRYDLVDNPAININGEKTYKIQARNRKGTSFFIAYQKSDNTIRIKSAVDNNDINSFIWKFDSGDPYDMYIYNLEGTAEHSDGVFTVRDVVNTGDKNGESQLSSIYYDDKNTLTYDQSASPVALQSFILTQGSNVGFNYENGWQDVWSNSFHIIGAYNGINNKPKDTGGSGGSYATPLNMPYYVCVNGSGDNAPGKDGDMLQFFRNWRVEDTKSTNVSQIKFIVVTQKYKFHIINNDGEEAMSAKTTSLLNVGDAITETMIPDILKSPAAYNYTFYPTAANAVAKTNPIEELPQDDDDIYVRYDTSSGFFLDGTIKYNLSVGGNHYLYAASNTTISCADASDATDTYKWTLHGGDPYQFTIKNVDNSQFITYDVSGGEAVPTLSGTGSKFFLHQSTEGKYELVVIDNNYPTSYYTLGYDGTNGLKLYSNTSYSFGAAEIQTVFSSTGIALINPLPTAKDLTYNGELQELVTAGICENGIVKYREGTEGDFTTAIPQKKDPGTYSVYYMSDGDEGYEDFIATDPIIVTIAPAPVTVTAVDKTKVYGETDPELTATVTGLISGEPDITYTINRATGEDANSYDITPAGDAVQGNYAVSFVNGTLTINQKTIGITWGETTFSYNGAPHAPTATATGLVNSDVIGITVTGAQTNVGNYTATASALTGTKKGNYQLPATKTTTFSIVKAAISTSIVMTEWSYGDYIESINSPSLSYNPENVGVTYRYKVKGANDETYVTTVPTNVGTYTVQASIPETSNSDAQILTKNFTISKKALNRDDSGTPANGITVTVSKVITNQGTAQETITYPVTVIHNVYGVPTTLTPYDAEHPENPYDYTLSGEQSVSGYVITVTARNENNVYTGNYTGFAINVYADPTFYLDGATWSPSGSEYAAVYLPLSDAVPNPVTDGSEIKAYIVRKVNPAMGTVTVSPVEYTIDDTTNPPTKENYIPKGVPVLLLSNNENLTGFTISPTTESTTDITAAAEYGNLLRIAPKDGVPVKDTEAYIFYEGEFVLAKEGTIKKDYFYFYNPNYQAQSEPGGGSAPAPRRSLQIVVQDTETGISRIVRDENREVQNDAWYTLDGRRLMNRPTQKGIYITNGKKVIIR